MGTRMCWRGVEADYDEVAVRWVETLIAQAEMGVIEKAEATGWMDVLHETLAGGGFLYERAPAPPVAVEPIGRCITPVYCAATRCLGTCLMTAENEPPPPAPREGLFKQPESGDLFRRPEEAETPLERSEKRA